MNVYICAHVICNYACIYLCMYLCSVCIFVCLFVCPSVCLSVSLSVCFIYLSVCYLFVCLSSICLCSIIHSSTDLRGINLSMYIRVLHAKMNIYILYIERQIDIHIYKYMYMYMHTHISKHQSLFCLLYETSFLDQWKSVLRKLILIKESRKTTRFDIS